MEHKEFRVTGCYDKKTLRELNFGSLYFSRGQLIYQLTMAAAMLWLAYLLWSGGDIWLIGGIVVWLVLMLFIISVGLLGGKQYKQMRVNNGGQIPEYELVFADDGIQVHKPAGEGTIAYPYDMLRRIGETRNLLLLGLEQELFLVVDKRRLQGGTKEELLELLLARCTKLKKRKVLGRSRLAVRFVILGVLLLAVLSGAVYQRPVDDYGYDDYVPPYRWANYLTGEELAARLEKLGFDPVDEEILAYLEEQWSVYTYEELPYIDKVTDLLWEIGCGSYEEDSWVFVPSSDDVYAYWEAFENGETMYDEFFRGIAPLGEGELDFTIVSDNTDDVDWVEGTGTRVLTLSWNGVEYTFDVVVDESWIDPCFVNDLNRLIAKSCDKQLYFGYDDYWNVYAFYCDQQWATQFYETTGMWLDDEMYEYDDGSGELWGESQILTSVLS